MNIQLLSDLHLEANPGFMPSAAAGADVLVIAGDIGSYQEGSALGGDDFGLAQFSPRRGWPCPVLYVPGNHEYDNLDFDATHGRLRSLCDDLGITWLEREVVVLGDVRFVGTTLWTDFDALAEDRADSARRLRARHKAFRAANFYLQRYAGTFRGEPMLAQAWRALGLECQQWLRAALAQPWTGPTVVVTHFAPSLRSADPRYGLTPGTAGFCNALDALLPLADFWLHGHLHCPQDWQAGRCRVLGNPLGYADKGEQAAFDPEFMLQVK